MATAFRHGVRYTYADYLAFEATSNVKHEFLDGQIYGMAGGTPQHARSKRRSSVSCSRSSTEARTAYTRAISTCESLRRGSRRTPTSR